MKTPRSKTIGVLIALFLVSTIAFTLALPVANAHTPPWNITTYAYLAVASNPTAVNEPLWLTMWLDQVPLTAGGFGGDRWRGFKVEVTKPDASKETLGPFTSDAIGTYSTQYTPTQVGTYSLQFSWPGQTLTNGTGIPEGRGAAFVGDYYKPATSRILELVVQDSITPYPNYALPLPNQYWNRPLQGDIRGWSIYASNWLRGSQLIDNFQPYGAAPDSAHILWTKELAFGGIVGDQFGEIPYSTDDYESPWSGGIIIQGRLYYNSGMYPKYGYYCVDLRTGEQIWFKNGTDNGLNNPFTKNPSNPTPSQVTRSSLDLAQKYVQPAFGQLYWYYSLNGQGVVAYLWMTVGTTWYMLDALTGNWILTLINVPGGTAVTAPDGSLLRYSYSATTGRLLCWNSSRSIPPLGAVSSESQQWKPRVGAVIDAVNDTSWTVIGPWAPRLTPDYAYGGSAWTAADVAPRSGYSLNVTATTKVPGSISRVLEDRVIIATTLPTIGSTGGDPMINFAVPSYVISALSLKQGQEGQLLWSKNYTSPAGDLTLSFGPMSIAEKIFTVRSKQTMQWWGYSLDTGELAWGPTESQDDWNMFGMASSYAYGNLYNVGYAGKLYAYDMKTGKHLWTYYAPNIGAECPYGQFPLSIGAIADGKIYLYSTEHSPTKPLWRGSRIRCINATTGEEIWTALHWSRGIAVADGILVSANVYDGQIYAFGKGQSAVTVSAPDDVQPLGTPVLLKGTITDQSPDAKNTPAIADASMGEWMEYLYMQKAMPTNATGVEVTLDTLDPNGNFVHIGTATSDLTGGFKKMFTPEVPGEYTIIATFAGSKSYYSSYAQTYLGVNEAPAASAAPEYPQPIDPTWTIVIGFVATIIAIAIVGLLILRKK